MITTKIRKITPDDAGRMLERNHLNLRPLNRRRVLQLAQIMKAGKWHITHQGLAFDSENNILDGQHRLHAIVESGVTIEIQVTEGLEQDTFAVIDVGKPRGVADALSIAGYSNTALLGAALRLAHLYEVADARPWTSVRLATTPDDIRLLAEGEGERMAHALPPAQRIKQRIGGSSAAYAAALFVIDKWAEKHDRERMFADWLIGLDTGADLETGDGRLALASWINGAAHLLPSGQTRTETLFMMVLRVFDAHIKGQRLAKIAIRNPASLYYRLPENLREKADT
jgi:hypothetical protein